MTITSRWIASAGLAGDAPVRALAERMTVATAAVATLSAFAGFMVPFPTFALFSPRRAQKNAHATGGASSFTRGRVDERGTYAASRAQVNNLKSEIKFPPRPASRAARHLPRRAPPCSHCRAGAACVQRKHYVILSAAAAVLCSPRRARLRGRAQRWRLGRFQPLRAPARLPPQSTAWA